MHTKTKAVEMCKRAIEKRCNEHGYIDHEDLADVLTELVDELRQGERTAEAGTTTEPE